LEKKRKMYRHLENFFCHRVDLEVDEMFNVVMVHGLRGQNNLTCRSLATKEISVAMMVVRG
jgi:hypothetical protein